MIIKSLISVFALFTFLATLSQSFNKEMDFVSHLQNIGEFEEGLLYLEFIDEKYFSAGQQDSLYYYKGKFHYRLKNFNPSISSFSMVSNDSDYLWNYAAMYSSIQYSYLKHYEKAIDAANRTRNLVGTKAELKKLFIVGNELLRRNTTAVDYLQPSFDLSYYQFKSHYEELLDLNKQIKEHKPKSPFVAGVLSGLLPGLGKYYQGMIGQGTMALITTGIFGLQAYEGYRKDGPKSARFIVFGSLLSVFYVANIWGSVVSVRIQNRDFNTSIDESILVNMHIPLRNLYR